MPNILARGAAVLKAKQEASASESLRVIRDATVLCDAWLATPGRTPIESHVEGVVVLGTQFDWLGDPSAWRKDAHQVEPARGDYLIWDRGDFELVFEVLPADGDNAWAPAGAYGERMRVHTKLIEKREK